MNPPVYTRNRLVSCGSSLLSESDNFALLKIIGNGRQSLSAGIVQIYKASQPSFDRWEYESTAIACLVKDHRDRCYLIYLFSLAKNQILLKEKLYTGFCYTTPRPYFHTFETRENIYGLNFAQSAEADHFHKALQEKTRIYKKSAVPTQPTQTQIATGTRTADLGKAIPNATAKTKKKKNKKNVITADMLSQPGDFIHVSHVGWDPNKGFDLDKVDPDLLGIFEAAGINASLIRDAETLDFVYDFIEKNGGLDALRSETETKDHVQKPPPRAPPSRPPIPAEPPSSQAPPLSPPSSQVAPPPPVTTHAAPPPPMTTPSAPPPPMTSHAAPPPPPRMAAVPSKPTNQQPAASSMRGNLLDSIRQGKSLTKVEKTEDELSQSAEEEGGIAAMLKKAIESRHNALNSDEDDWTDRDEWSD